MNNYDWAGAHVIRDFLYEKLIEQNLIIASDYQGIKPIVPSQEVPEVSNLASGKPYLVYTYSPSSERDDWWMCGETVSYRVYSDQETDLRNIVHFMIDLFKRMDDSAADVNEFIDSNPEHRMFDFKWITVMDAIGPEPYDESGGRQASVITIQYMYTHELDDNGMRLAL